MNSHSLLAKLAQTRLMATVRVDSAEAAFVAAQALVDGGLPFVEIALTTPDALDVIAELSKRSDVCVGAGSVMTVADAHKSVDAGASYLVSPIFDPEVVRCSVETGALVAAGAATPSEAMAGWKLGAHITKLFPVEQLGGPGFLKAIRAPMPFLRLLPTGGVTPDNAAAYLAAGAFALGMGSNVVHSKLAAQGDLAGLTHLAQQAVAAVNAAVSSLGTAGGVPGR